MHFVRCALTFKPVDLDAGAHVLLLFRELKLAHKKINVLEEKIELLEGKTGHIERDFKKVTAEMAQDTSGKLKAKITALEEKTEAIQRDMNNVSVTMVPFNKLKQAEFCITFAPVLLGNHSFRMWFDSTVEKEDTIKGDFWKQPTHKLSARIEGRRCSDDYFYGGFKATNIEIKGHVILSISVPDHPSLPKKTEKLEFTIPVAKKSSSYESTGPVAFGGEFLFDCTGWPAATIR